MTLTKTTECLWCGVAVAQPVRGRRLFCSDSHRVMARREVRAAVGICSECEGNFDVPRRPGPPPETCGMLECVVARRDRYEAGEADRRRQDRVDFWVRMRQLGLADLENTGFSLHDDHLSTLSLGRPDGAHDLDPRVGDWDWQSFVDEFGLVGADPGQTFVNHAATLGAGYGSTRLLCSVSNDGAYHG